MNNKIKIIFFGTPDIAAEILESLIKDDVFEILGVVTQMDKPYGRKMVLTPPPVKIVAEKYELKVWQPDFLRKDNDLYTCLKALTPDYFVVVAYGQILSQKWLDLPNNRAVNLHASLLPKYRGASPMQESLKNGDAVTGITLQNMVLKMDAGEILAAQEINIDKNDTLIDLTEKVVFYGKQLIPAILKADFESKLSTIAQNEQEVAYCSKISKNDGLIDFNTMPVSEIYNLYRAYKLWPGIYTYLNGKRFKLLDVEIVQNVYDGEFGMIKIIDNEIFIIGKNGTLKVNQLQLEGKKAMQATNFLVGNKINGLILSNSL